MLFHADCRDVLKSLSDNSIDSCVTDPPYALVSIVKRFGSPNAAPARGNEAYMRASAGFMGKTWDNGETAFSTEFWKEVLRVLKPGAHVAAFGASRGYHRMACAIEDAGFEIRDSLAWMYGTGFPKGHDISKGIDRELEAKREIIGRSDNGIAGGSGEFVSGNINSAGFKSSFDITAPATDAAREWDGWNTALKPAFEPIVLARKPLSEKTIAANVLKWGTGALNIGGCRVPTDETIVATRNIALGSSSGGIYNAATTPGVYAQNDKGRWPANVIHDGSDEVTTAFPNDSSRFFYSAKANKTDRAGSKHPTVKPVALMEWLCTLITPPGGIVLDPFAGSGTTGQAAINKGFRYILCEREAEYVRDIKRRLDKLNFYRWNEKARVMQALLDARST